MNPPPTSTTTAAPEVHGHEVIAMILESARSYTRQSLAEAIVARFGPDTRFFTCSASGMDAQAMVAFLESRGKFMPLEDGFTINPDRVCSH